MATADVLRPKAIYGFNEKAYAFVNIVKIAVDNDTKDDSEDPKTKDVPVFILNSEDFIDLQLYLQASMKLPPTPEVFETVYTRKAFGQFLTKDPSLYDSLRIQLPMIYQHCHSFQGSTVGSMISLGGYISNFAKDASSYHKQISDELKIITDKNLTLKSVKVKRAIARARNLLKKLKSYAKETREECKELVGKLGEFRTTTESDKTQLDALYLRFRRAVPDNEGLKSTLQKIVGDAGQALATFRAEQGEHRRRAVGAGRRKWYWYIPWLGVVFIIVDWVRHKGLMRIIMNIQQRHEDVKEAEMCMAFNQISSLNDSVESIYKTIEAAISAVNNMMTTFSMLETDFDTLRRRLGSIEGSIDEEYVEDRLVGIEDLENASETWRKVYEVARQFQEHGMILDIKEHPDMPA